MYIVRHRGVQLILAYSWARPAVLVAGKGRGGNVFIFSVSSLSFLFLFLICHSLSPLLLSLLSLFSLSLGDDTKWPTRVDVSLNPNTIKHWPHASLISISPFFIRKHTDNLQIAIFYWNYCDLRVDHLSLMRPYLSMIWETQPMFPYILKPVEVFLPRHLHRQAHRTICYSEERSSKMQLFRDARIICCTSGKGTGSTSLLYENTPIQIYRKFHL